MIDSQNNKNNKDWADKILKRVDPKFKHRWEVYDEFIRNTLNSNTIWIDCGCVNNETIKAYSHLAKEAIGIDSIEPKTSNGKFIKADIKNLPFTSGYADLITLRFVVEHFDAIEPYFLEIARILKKRGKVVILTTNLLSPIIYVPKILFPFPLKNKILTKLFRVDSVDIFPTYHKVNTIEQLKKVTKDIQLKHIEFISDLNYTRKWIFLILLSWHVFTRFKRMEKFRTNILTILEKT